MEIYTPKQMVAHANERFEKYLFLVETAINERLKQEFDCISDCIDISDIFEFYQMDLKHRVWNRVVNDYCARNWDIFPIRVQKYQTFDDRTLDLKWKVAVRNLKK
jgi:hypothetical protein